MIPYMLSAGTWYSKSRFSYPADGFRLGIDKPTEANSGVPAGTVLTDWDGSNVISQNNVTIKRRRFNFNVGVSGRNVTFEECEFATTGGNIVTLTNANTRNVVFKRCTVRTTQHADESIGIIGHDFITYRCKIIGTVDGIRIFNSANPGGKSNVRLQGDFIGDLTFTKPYAGHGDGETHNDGVQIEGGLDTVIIGCAFRALGHPTFSQWGDSTRAPYVLSCIIVTPNVGPVHGLKLYRNWFDGGYAALNISQKDWGPITDLGIVGNRWSGNRAQYDALIQTTTQNANDKTKWVNNIREDTGLAVVFGGG